MSTSNPFAVGHDVLSAFRLFYLEHAYTLRQSTKQTMESQLRRFNEVAGNPDIADIDTELFQDVKKTLSLRGNSNASINSIIRAVTSVLRHCGPQSHGCPHGRDLIAHVPYPGRKLPERRSPKWIPSLDELSNMYTAAAVAQWPGGHVAPATFWRCLLVVAYNTGLRHSDLLKLDWDAVDFTDRTITVVCQKTLKTQHFPINDITERHLLMMKGDERVFPCTKSNKIFARELKRISREAGTKHEVTLQAIRRRSGTSYETTRNGAGQLLLGHTSGGVSFLHYIAELEVLRAAADELPQPKAFVDGPGEYIAIARKSKRSVNVPVAVTDRRNWGFPADGTRFVFKGVQYRMEGRTLALLRLLVTSREAVTMDAIRRDVYDGFPDVSDNTIKGVLSFLRERLRELFGLPEWFNPVPARRGRWFLALPEIQPEPQQTIAPAKHTIAKFRKSDWKIHRLRVSYRGREFQAAYRSIRALRKLIDADGEADLQPQHASKLREQLRSGLGLPDECEPLPCLRNNRYVLDVPAID